MTILELCLDGILRRVEISQQQLDAIYQPVVERVVNLQKECRRRILVGITGPPGCGKTHFSAILAHLINLQDGRACAISAGMDGWHYPRQLLEEKKSTRGGKTISLSQIKGSPESFDAAGFCVFLSSIQKQEQMRFPVYDRRFHDPRPQGGEMLPGHSIVLVDGNYLLLPEPAWQDIRPMLDLTCFIWAGESLRWKTLIKRHMSGGKSIQQAIFHINSVDVPNALRIGRPAADIVLERISADRMIVQHW